MPHFLEMDVRRIKKEVEALPRILRLVEQAQKEWLRPLEQELINGCSLPVQQLLRQHTRDIRLLLQKLAEQQPVQEKLHLHARQVLELKLSKLQRNNGQSKVLAKRFLEDKVFNIQQTIQDVKEMTANSQEVGRKADILHAFLDKHGSLELQLRYHDLPQRRLLGELHSLCQQQQRLLQDIGNAFVTMVRE